MCCTGRIGRVQARRVVEPVWAPEWKPARGERDACTRSMIASARMDSPVVGAHRRHHHHLAAPFFCPLFGAPIRHAIARQCHRVANVIVIGKPLRADKQHDSFASHHHANEGEEQDCNRGTQNANLPLESLGREGKESTIRKHNPSADNYMLIHGDSLPVCELIIRSSI